MFEDRLASAASAGHVIGQIAAWASNPNLVQIFTRDKGVIIARIRPEDIDRLDLRVGLAVATVAEALRCLAAQDQTRRIALSLLARRDFSSAALIDRLVKRGSASDVARSIVAELTDQGWIDDARYARMLAEQAMAQGKATALALSAILSRHQIDAATSELTIAGVLTDVDPVAQALAVARKRLSAMPNDLVPHTRVRRLTAYLARRGFDEDTIRSVIETACPGADDSFFA